MTQNRNCNVISPARRLQRGNGMLRHGEAFIKPAFYTPLVQNQDPLADLHANTHLAQVRYTLGCWYDSLLSLLQERDAVCLSPAITRLLQIYFCIAGALTAL